MTNLFEPEPKFIVEWAAYLSYYNDIEYGKYVYEEASSQRIIFYLEDHCWRSWRMNKMKC